LIDFDGTIAPFRAARDEARPYPGISDILDSILESGCGGIGIISGRGIEDLVQRLELRGQPELWGCHGFERLTPDGIYSAPELEPAAVAGLENARRSAEREGFMGRLEQKTFSVALHWRGETADGIKDICGTMEPLWRETAEKHGLELRRFDGGIELRPPGRNKGYAVRTILEESSERILLAYMGDDETDEDAFKALRPEDLGVLVNEKLRSTAADLWLRPPDEVAWFLDRWAEACGG
jgi:trehalose-phosphatase